VLSATVGLVVGILPVGEVLAVDVLLDGVVLGIGKLGGSPAGIVVAPVVVPDTKAVAPCPGV